MSGLVPHPVAAAAASTVRQLSAPVVLSSLLADPGSLAAGQPHARTAGPCASAPSPSPYSLERRPRSAPGHASARTSARPPSPAASPPRFFTLPSPTADQFMPRVGGLDGEGGEATLKELQQQLDVLEEQDAESEYERRRRERVRAEHERTRAKYELILAEYKDVLAEGKAEHEKHELVHVAMERARAARELAKQAIFDKMRELRTRELDDKLAEVEAQRRELEDERRELEDLRRTLDDQRHKLDEWNVVLETDLRRLVDYQEQQVRDDIESDRYNAEQRADIERQKDEGEAKIALEWVKLGAHSDLMANLARADAVKVDHERAYWRKELLRAGLRVPVLSADGEVEEYEDAAGGRWPCQVGDEPGGSGDDEGAGPDDAAVERAGAAGAAGERELGGAGEEVKVRPSRFSGTLTLFQLPEPS